MKKFVSFFFTGYPYEYIKLEFRNALEMQKNKIKIAKPFEIITINNRYGIIYEKIEGKTLQTMILQKEETLDTLLDMLVKLQQNIISHHTNQVLSYKIYLLATLKNQKTHHTTILNRIDALPDDDCLLHGDFHPSNIIVMEDSTPVVIDFMNVCCGPALYDMARTFCLLKQSDSNVADLYLKKMNITKCDLSKYINLIEFCRKLEN